MPSGDLQHRLLRHGLLRGGLRTFARFEEIFSGTPQSGCLRKDREVQLTFYDFPAENWCHIRTTNPIASTFATIRLRHRKTKNNGSAKASLVMIFKLAQSASKGWRKLRGHQHIPELIRGVRFIDGVIEQPADELKSSTTKSPTTHTEIVA